VQRCNSLNRLLWPIPFVVIGVACGMVPIAEAQTEGMLFDFEGAFDVETARTRNAQVAIAKDAAGQALEVKLAGQGGRAEVMLKSDRWKGTARGQPSISSSFGPHSTNACRLS